MSDDVVHVHLNEGRAQFFQPMDNGRANDGTYPVPRTVWEPFVEAERQVEAAEANLTAALQVLLDAIKAVAPTDDEDEHVHEYVVEGDRLYWP